MPLVALTITGVQDTNEKVLALLHENHFDTVVLSPDLTEEERIEALKPCDAVLAGMERYTDDILAQLPNLKIIARQGVGCDSIDLDACKARGIKVAKATGAVEKPVAELCFAMILQFSRELSTLSHAMRNHEWKPVLAEGLQGKRIGLIGFGGIGKEVAKLAAAFNMNIYYYTRYRDEHDSHYRATHVTFATLLQKSDYVVVNVPLNDSTYHLIGAEELKQMKKNAVLINTARGAVVDEAALAEALHNGTIRGAGVDVFDQEPTTTSPLMDCPNAVLTPHTGTYTYRGILDMGIAAAWNIIDALQTED